MNDFELDRLLAQNPELRRAVERRIEEATRSEIRRLVDAAFDINRTVPLIDKSATVHDHAYARMSGRALSWFDQASDKSRNSYLEALVSLHHSETCERGSACKLSKPCLISRGLLTCLDHVMSCTGCETGGCRALASKMMHMFNCDKAHCDACVNVFMLLQLHSDICELESCDLFLCDVLKGQSDKALICVAKVSATNFVNDYRVRCNSSVAS